MNVQRTLWRMRSLPSNPPETSPPRADTVDEYGLSDIPHAIVVNNFILPFLVSSLEAFLRRFFAAYVDSHQELSERVFERQGKIEYAELRPILEGAATLADHEAEKWSFQSLAAASKAYETYVGIKLLRVWNKRKKFEGRYYVVRDVLQELIELRHRIVHDAYIDAALKGDETFRYIRFVEHAVQMFANSLEREKGFRIDLEKHL